VTATAPISSTGGDTPVISHDTSGVTAGTYDSVTVDAKGHVTAGTNPGGSGGGIFSGSKAINNSTNVTAFTLQRSTGTLIFDVWLTSETSTATSVSKKYTVAHSYGTTPVYNKIIDTGPDGSNDFTVSFANAGTGGDSVNCSIISNSIAAQTIGYTVQVGHDGTNALTFTAG
jgi:phage-related tail fiber protein